jgi:hypothetical protein
MGMDHEAIEAGMDVVGADGVFIGLVTQVRDGDFLVRRSMLRHVYVPLGDVRGVAGDRVELAIPADLVDAMGWPGPLGLDSQPGA